MILSLLAGFALIACAYILVTAIAAGADSLDRLAGPSRSLVSRPSDALGRASTSGAGDERSGGAGAVPRPHAAGVSADAPEHTLLLLDAAERPSPTPSGGGRLFGETR